MVDNGGRLDRRLADRAAMADGWHMAGPGYAVGVTRTTVDMVIDDAVC